jgi:MFS family permease
MRSMRSTSIMNRLKSSLASFSLSKTFASLKYPNYKIWFVGQLTSLFGTWMQTNALGFFVYDLTKLKSMLGLVAFASGAPTILLMLFGGMAADRIPKKKLLIATQTALMILAFALAALTFLGITQVWHIIVIALFSGIANAFDMPARQAFVLEMVDKKMLTNAIALNSMMFNIATAAGPALGGITYAFFGPAWCFVINGISFVAVLAALLLMRFKGRRKRTITIEKNGIAASAKTALVEIGDGFKHIGQIPLILLIMVIVSAASFFGFSLFALFPAWAVNMLKGDATTNGFLQSFRGIGALASAFIIASIGNSKHRGTLLRAGTIAFPLALLGFAFARWQLLSFVLVLAAGVGLMFVYNLANGMVQSVLHDEYRGRVMSIYSLVFLGFSSIGSLVLGFIADIIGGQIVFAGSSIVLVLFSIIIFAVAKAKGIVLLKK